MLAGEGKVEGRVLFVKSISLSFIKVMSILAIDEQNGCTTFLTFSCARNTDIIYLSIISSDHRRDRSTLREIEFMLCTIELCYPPSEDVL